VGGRKDTGFYSYIRPNIPEFERARRGTLAWMFYNKGGMASMQHTFDETFRKMWYPRNMREYAEWVQFMLNTPVAPTLPPAYTAETKAERQAELQYQRGLHYGGWRKGPY
jgi:hypothetical protein